MVTAVDLDPWTLSAAERAFVAKKNAANRLDTALLLKCFQHDGRFPDSTATLDREVLLHVMQQLGVAAVPTGTIAVRTLGRLRAEIRTFCGYREASVEDAAQLTQWVCDHAVAQSRNHDILTEALLGECRRHCIEPPVADRIDRIVRSAVHAAVHAYEDRWYGAILAGLSPLTRARLDTLLQPAEGDNAGTPAETASRAVINTLREDAGHAGVKSIRGELAKVEIIRKLELPAQLFDHALPHELEMYRQRVAVEAPYELRRHPEAARLSWLAAFAFLGFREQRNHQLG